MKPVQTARRFFEAKIRSRLRIDTMKRLIRSAGQLIVPERPPTDGPDTIRILHCSDLHGSSLCFRLALEAGREYRAHAVVISGDLTGKSLTPIVRIAGDVFQGVVSGKKETVHGGLDSAQMQEDIANSGSYPYLVSEEELSRLRADGDFFKECIRQAAEDRLKRWLLHAQSVLSPAAIRLLLICGNDDPWSLNEIIRQYPIAEDLESPPYASDSVRLGDHEVIGESGGQPHSLALPQGHGRRSTAQSNGDKGPSSQGAEEGDFRLTCSASRLGSRLGGQAGPESASCPPGRTARQGSGREHGGSEGRRAVPAPAEPPRSCPRVARLPKDWSDPLLQPRQRVRQG